MQNEMCLWNAFGEFACSGGGKPAAPSASVMEGFSDPMGYSTLSSAPAPVNVAAKKHVLERFSDASKKKARGSAGPMEGFSSAKKKQPQPMEGFCGCQQ